MISRASEIFGSKSDFHFLVISSLADSSMWVTTVQKRGGGDLSMPRLRIANVGSGGVSIPVIAEINLKMFHQKLVRCLHFQNMCKRCPFSPHPLQHNGEEFGYIFEIR